MKKCESWVLPITEKVIGIYAKQFIKWEITFNLTINKETLNCNIDILDEDFLQPYPYEKHNDMVRKVNEIVNDLKEKGVIYE